MEYDKAKGGEPVEITFTFDGDNRGLAIKDYTGTIEGEGSGKIELPITGTPSDIGVVKLNMKMTIEGKTIFDDVISLNIQSENFIFSMDFGKFVWGGDLMANKKGKCPGGKQVSGQDITGLEEADGEVSVGTDGAGDAFKSLGETYRINRDLVGWQGERVYEHPGYIKLGTGSNNGWIQTPKMDKLSSAPQTVVVSFDISLYDKSDDLILFTAEGAGSVEGGGNISLPTFSGWANAKWTTCTFVVNGATSATSFKWASTKTDGKGRFVLDNISVMSSAVKERTEPLEKVDAERILYTSGANSIEVEWPGVADATGYEVALVPQENPSFVNKAVVPAAEGVDDVFSHEFTDLQPGFYIFEIVALYEPNPEFDSEKVSVLLGTEGFLAGPLKTPEATASATSYAVTISWETVSGASGYKAVLKEAGAVVKEQSVDADALSCTFGELTPDRDYAVAVQALYESKPEYNSEFTADIAVHTPALLTRPVVHLYDGFEVTHNMAIVEWDIDAAQQSDTKTSLQLLEGSKLIYNFSKWGLPSAKYKFPRFVFGGLKANTTYTARIQRISADASKFGDSEWGEYTFGEGGSFRLSLLCRFQRTLVGRQRCGHRIRHVSQDGEGRSDGRPDPVGLYVRHAGQEHAQPQQRLRRGAGRLPPALPLAVGRFEAAYGDGGLHAAFVSDRRYPEIRFYGEQRLHADSVYDLVDRSDDRGADFQVVALLRTEHFDRRSGSR